MKKKAFCYLTHTMSNYVLDQISRIKKELHGTNTDILILWDITQMENKNDSKLLLGVKANVLKNNTSSECHVYTYTFEEYPVKTIMSMRGYDVRYYEEPNRKLFYGNCFLMPMSIYKEILEDYEYVWMCEYDVYFNGDWKVLLDHYEDDDTDFIANNIKGFDKTWWHAKQFNFTTLDIPEEEFKTSFNPIMRFSADAMSYLDVIYKEGNSGFYEMFIPTVLSHNGMQIKSFADNGFATEETFRYIQNSTMSKDEITKEDMLYHPVKTL